MWTPCRNRRETISCRVCNWILLQGHYYVQDATHLFLPSSLQSNLFPSTFRCLLIKCFPDLFRFLRPKLFRKWSFGLRHRVGFGFGGICCLHIQGRVEQAEFVAVLCMQIARKGSSIQHYISTKTNDVTAENITTWSSHSLGWNGSGSFLSFL